MENTSNRRSLILIALVGFFIVSFTYLISIFARGYRFSLKNGFTLNPTGIISAVSYPKGASVYINDKLITATDDTFNLSPGVYNLKINKDGFNQWQKNITVKTETVYQADIQLFSSVPDLKPITLTGAINPSANSDNTKIVYAVASASATKDNGCLLYTS
nr:PEGA domain-containing protein [Candidatus Shapirobacteria bacterium]